MTMWGQVHSKAFLCVSPYKMGCTRLKYTSHILYHDVVKAVDFIYITLRDVTQLPESPVL